MSFLMSSVTVPFYPHRVFARIDYSVLAFSGSTTYINFYKKLEHPSHKKYRLYRIIKYLLRYERWSVLQTLVHKIKIGHLPELTYRYVMETGNHALIKLFLEKYPVKREFHDMWFDIAINNHDLQTFIDLSQRKISNNLLLGMAIKRECLPIIKYIYAHAQQYYLDANEAIFMNLRYNVTNTEVLQYFIAESSLPRERKITLNIENGLFSFLPKIDPDHSHVLVAQHWLHAIRKNNLAACQYLQAHNCPFHPEAYFSCQNLEIFQWLLTYYPELPNQKQIMNNAITFRLTEILRYFVQQGFVDNFNLMQNTFSPDIMKIYYEEYLKRKIKVCQKCGNFFNNEEGLHDLKLFAMHVNNNYLGTVNYLFTLCEFVPHNCAPNSCLRKDKYTSYFDQGRMWSYSNSLYLAFYENSKKYPLLPKGSFFYWNTKKVTAEIYEQDRRRNSIAYRKRFLKSYDGPMSQLYEKFFN